MTTGQISCYQSGQIESSRQNRVLALQNHKSRRVVFISQAFGGRIRGTHHAGYGRLLNLSRTRSAEKFYSDHWFCKRLYYE
jgi:hypothetical protein